MPSAASDQLQISNATSFMRYSDYYSRIKAGLLTTPTPRILVFGCSTGAELRTIHTFWPDAEIYGCDIDDDVLDAARAEAPFAHVFKSSNAAIADLGGFDMVCANSVLCRHPFPKTGYAHELSFATFESYVTLLMSALRPGGYLFIYNTNYFIQDLEAAADLSAITIADAWSGSFVPRVDRDGHVVALPAVLDGVLRRYLISGDFDPFDRMRTALFRLAGGPTLALNDRIRLQAGAALAPAVTLPEPSHAQAFEPFIAEARVGADRVCTTYLHNPRAGGWDLHGTHLASERG